MPAKKLVTDRKLVRDISTILMVKVVLLYGIWYAFFSDPETLDNEQGTARALLGEPADNHRSGIRP